MLESLSNIQYCYEYVINQISVGLLLYAHLPAALLALVFGVFILRNGKNRPSRYLFVICVSFAAWAFLSLGSWFVFMGHNRMMFAWSLIDMFGLLFFVCSYAFIYTFFSPKDLPVWQKVIGLFLLIPTLVWTALGMNLEAFDANTCEAIENDLVTLYPYYVQGFIIISSMVLLIRRYVAAKEKMIKREIVLVGTGVLLFLGFFFASTLGTRFLISETALEFAYNFEIYGLFGMPVLLGYLGYLIVRYKAFNLKIAGAEALVIALIALIASQFAFVNSLSNQILVAVTLVLTCAAGITLVKSVRLEIEHREVIEKLAQTLDETNGRQETLIHFIGHEVKGFLTKDSGTFAALLDGDFGTIPDTAKPLVEQALASSRNGADSVATILKASNLKKGTVAYDKKLFDMKELVSAAVERAKSMATQKSLNLSLSVGEGDYKTVGDGPQINDHVLRNLIENAINYTPSGKVEVSLSRKANRIVFAVKDSGVGITEADKKRLFTEGGHGENSQKVNAHSTGYGLFIAKQITEAHAGTIRADSEGEGKGSTFTVEFPVVKEVPAAAAATKA